jgi:hypothetical protein
MRNLIKSFAYVSIIVILTTSAAWAGSVPSLNIFASGTRALAADVNANFSAVKTAVDDNDARITPLEDLDGHSLDSFNGSIIDALFVDNQGEVGIGTSDPSAALEISADSAKISLKSTLTSGGESVIEFGDFVTRYFIRNPANTNRLHIVVNTSTPREAITVGTFGEVGISNVNPNADLDVVGDIEYTGTITDVSDERLKENVVPIKGALDKIKAINGVYFNMIKTPGRTELGVVAQNVKEVLPEAVSVVEPAKGYLGVSYPSIIPVLIEAIKEQQKQIDELRARLSEKQ